MGFREVVVRSSVTDWCIAAFTLALVVTSAYQNSSMQGQLNVMKDDQRPWVGIKDIGPGSPLIANVPFSIWIDLRNFGKSPAFLKEQASEMRLLDGDFPDTVEFSEPLPAGYDREGEPLLPGDIGIKLAPRKIFSEDEVDKVKSGKLHLYVFGRIKYTKPSDSNIHITRFCWQLEAIGNMEIKGIATPNIIMAGCHGLWSYAD